MTYCEIPQGLYNLPNLEVLAYGIIENLEPGMKNFRAIML